MDMGLQRFVRRTAEASRGTGEALNALRELRLDATKLVTMDLSAQMGLVAEAFSNVKTEADKVRLAQKLFDSEGVALVGTLKQGSAALDDMRKEAEDLKKRLDIIE